MEESGCVADNVGGAGEQGIMQITDDKCPNGQPGTAWFVDPFSFIELSLASLTSPFYDTCYV